MAIDQEILNLLEGRELNVKNLAIELERSAASLYKPLAGLVTEGLIKKREKESQGKMIAFYSIPSEEGIEGCSWQDHKGILVAGRTYQKKVLEAGFWPSLEQDILTLGEREENRHIAVVGLVGLGKSNTAIFLARLLDPSFAVNDIIFTRERLLELVADQPEHKSFVLDDIGVMLSSRGWQEKERGLIFSWLEICRMHRINTIATSPSLAMIDVNYQRLLHYVLQVELKCKGHIHIIVFKPTQAGLKPIFKPVGILTLDLPGGPFFSIFQEYQGVKQKDLALSARASLERLKLAKTGVQEYIQEREISRVTDDVVRSALHTVGLNGNLPKADKDTLRVAMYDTLEQKKQREKKSKGLLVKQGKVNLRKAKLSTSYRNKYQAYVDKGRSEQYSKTLAYRLTYERSRAGNLKNLEGVVGSLMRKLKPSLVEGLTLGRLDDIYLVRDLRALRDLLGLFKSFDQQFYSKLFAFIQYDPKKAIEFIQKTKEMRISYRYRGRFSPKKWRESVLFELGQLEQGERWNDALVGLAQLAAAGIGYIAKKPDWVNSALAYQKRKFWGDV